MSSLDPRYRRIPGILLLVLGLGLLLFAGGNWYQDFGQEEYEYHADQAVHVYDVSELSASEQRLVRAGINESEQTVSEVPARFRHPDERFPTYFVADNQTYYEVNPETDDTGNMSFDIEGEYQREILIHEYSALSEKGQKVVQKAAGNPDEEVTVGGALPPEFSTGTDAPGINDGRYYVHYDGEYYYLTIDDANPVGLGAGLLSVLYLIAGMTGIVFSAIGSASAYLKQIGPPIATVVTSGVFVGLPLATDAGFVVTLVAGSLAGVGSWFLLSQYDLEAAENDARSVR